MVTSVKCRFCGGSCFSPAGIADQLRRLAADAHHYAAEVEPEDVVDGALRLEAERTYLELAHRQLANELDGICTACWLMGAAVDRKWIN